MLIKDNQRQKFQYIGKNIANGKTLFIFCPRTCQECTKQIRLTKYK